MGVIEKDILTKIRGLSPRQRKALVRSIIREGILSEEEEDALLVKLRRHEPTVPAEEFFARLDRQRESRK